MLQFSNRTCSWEKLLCIRVVGKHASGGSALREHAVVLQVAQGMAGLEGEDPPIVHRDLKPSNVFVDGAGVARVADMNLSLRLNEESLAMLTGETGTYLYMSPEMMRHEVCHPTDTVSWNCCIIR